MDTIELTSLCRAVDLAGGQGALARHLRDRGFSKIQQGHVWYWLNKSRKAPANIAPAIEEIVRGEVTRSQLRPDVFGPPAHTRGQAA